MSMEPEKLNIIFPEGKDKAEVIIRETDKVVEDKLPVLEPDMKKKEIDFRGKLKTLMDEAQSSFEKGKDKGLLILYYDGELPDNKCALDSLILGSKEALCIGGAMLMEKKKEARDVLSDIVSFYNFHKNPKAGLVKMLADTLDNLADDLKKLKAKPDEEKAD